MPEGWMPAADEEPYLPPSAESLWEAWEALEWSRPVGFSVGAIPVSEVLSYCALLGVTDLDQRERILRAVQALDCVYLKHVADEQKKHEKG